VNRKKEGVMTDLENFLLEEFAMIWRVLKEADIYLEAHKNAITALLTEYPNLQESLDARLASSSQSPDLREKMNQKYALILETSLRRFPGELPREARERLERLENL
jgi:hypothetical protein